MMEYKIFKIYPLEILNHTKIVEYGILKTTERLVLEEVESKTSLEDAERWIRAKAEEFTDYTILPIYRNQQ